MRSPWGQNASVTTRLPPESRVLLLEYRSRSRKAPSASSASPIRFPYIYNNPLKSGFVCEKPQRKVSAIYGAMLYAVMIPAHAFAPEPPTDLIVESSSHSLITPTGVLPRKRKQVSFEL